MVDSIVYFNNSYLAGFEKSMITFSNITYAVPTVVIPEAVIAPAIVAGGQITAKRVATPIPINTPELTPTAIATFSFLLTFAATFFPWVSASLTFCASIPDFN